MLVNSEVTGSGESMVMVWSIVSYRMKKMNGCQELRENRSGGWLQVNGWSEPYEKTLLITVSQFWGQLYLMQRFFGVRLADHRVVTGQVENYILNLSCLSTE